MSRVRVSPMLFFALAAGLGCWAGLSAPQPANAAEKTLAPQTASLEPGAREDWRAQGLEQILSDADVSRYRVIFQLQEAGEWKDADKIIATLDDDILMGHVLAQRYLHPTKYRSKYAELKAWMDKYADHPDARRIYNLALKRRPKNWKMPKEPVGGPAYRLGGDSGPPRTAVYAPVKKLDEIGTKMRREIDRKLNWYFRNGWTKAVKDLLREKKVEALYHPVAFDRLRGRLGFAYFTDGRDAWGLEWAGAAAGRSGQYLPEAHWAAGLSAWRLGKFERARKDFAAVAQSKYASPWMISAGAFWAARADLKSRHPKEVNKWLGIASAYPRTFYGLLARRQLGIPVTFDWEPPPMAEEALRELAVAPGGRRAVTLLQVGEDHRAERELRNLFGKATPELARAMLALADRAKLPSLAMRLSSLLVESGSSLYDSTAYPVPSASFPALDSADAALILALIRQESGFNPKAKSSRGARGLMQLMPGTASFVARDRAYRSAKREELFDPETNVEIGQKYIDILLADNRVDGDLFRLAMAWNGGPGNLGKWRRTIAHNNDPLLFIESIPLRETRIFVERVITNYWIYRLRLGEPTLSLDAAAAGQWPGYSRSVEKNLEVAEDGPRNR